MPHTCSSQNAMTATLNLTITDAGRTAAISADGVGLRLTLTHAALGKGAYEPQTTQTAMVNRVETVPVTNIGGTAPVATARLAASFPALAVAMPVYSAFELGLYAGHPDAGGVLFAVASSSTPILVRGAFDFLVAFGLTLSGVPTGSVTVQIDPDAALYLQLLGEHDRDPDAHADFARKASVAVQGYTSGVTTGSGSDYLLAISSPPATLARFTRVTCLVHATNTGAATLTLGSLLPRAIKVYAPSGEKEYPAFGRMTTGMVADLEFDGTDWVLINPIPAPVMTSVRIDDVLITPSQTGGDGTQGSPLLLPDASSAPGAASAVVASVRVSGLRPGEVAMVADLGDTDNGARFSAGALVSRVANGAGVVNLPITFSDAPTSAVGVTHVMNLVVNGLYIRHRRIIASTATISAPVITAPLANATGIMPRPTINLGAFFVTGGTSTHVSTSWQISTSQTFDSLFVQSPEDTTNKLTWMPPTLSYSTTFYVRAKFHGTSSSSNWSAPLKFTTHAQPAVTTPSVIYPSSGATGIAVSPRFSSTAFAVTNTTDTHRWSDWQISSTVDFASVLFSATNSTTDLTAWTPTGNLSYQTTYFVRVRHNATGLGASAWSTPVQFSTGASTPIVATPTITSPVANATGVKGPFISSGFNLASGVDSHASSDWQIASSTTFAGAAIIASTAGDVASKTSWSPSASLPRGTYYVRVRHNGVAGGASAWSQPVAFTWLLTARPMITYPTADETNIDQGLSITTGPFSSSGADRHIQTDWQISTASDFASIAIALNASPTSLTSWSPSGLLASTRYYVRVRHNGESGGLSDWSQTVSFTTAAASGVSWSPGGASGTGVLRGVAFGGSKLVVVGSSTVGAYGTGALITSSDGGLSWPDKVEMIGGVRVGTPYSVLYTGSKWVAVGYDGDGSVLNGAAYVSTDGATWGQYSTGAGLLRDISWDGTRLMGAGGSASLDPVLKSSLDGVVWTDGVSLASQCGALLTIEWAAEIGLWIAGGMTTAKTESAGAILTSLDRVTWTRSTLPADVGVINKIVWSGTTAIAVGMTSAASLGAGVVLTSTDGRNWTRRSLLCGALYAAEWALSKWVVGGYTRAGTESAGEVWTSADGVSWTARSTGSGRVLALCQASAARTAGPLIGVGFTTAGVTSAGGIYRS